MKDRRPGRLILGANLGIYVWTGMVLCQSSLWHRHHQTCALPLYGTPWIPMKPDRDIHGSSWGFVSLPPLNSLPTTLPTPSFSFMLFMWLGVRQQWPANKNPKPPQPFLKSRKEESQQIDAQTLEWGFWIKFPETLYFSNRPWGGGGWLECWAISVH